MPGLITHYICGEAVYESLGGDMKAAIRKHRQLYNVGTQGPDVFFYYLPGLLNKKIAGLGSKMHKGDFGLFMQGMAESILEADGDLKMAAAAYLCGYLTHYALDRRAHPYIYYKTGSRDAAAPVKSLRHTVYHRNFETAIDVLMLKLVTGEKTAQKKLWQLIHTTKKETAAVTELIGQNIRGAYQTAITGNQVYRAFAYMAGLTRLMQSAKGRRKRLMAFVEGATVGEQLYSSLIHPQEITDAIDYLNLNKNTWYLPWDNVRQQNQSFTELFGVAVDESLDMVRALDQYLKGAMTTEALVACTGSFSFATGLHFNEKVDFKFHDIVYAAERTGG